MLGILASDVRAFCLATNGDFEMPRRALALHLVDLLGIGEIISEDPGQDTYACSLAVSVNHL